MIGGRLGLAGLVERARDRALQRQSFKRWLINEEKWPGDVAESCLGRLKEIAGRVCDLCRLGYHREALCGCWAEFQVRDEGGAFSLHGECCPAWVSFEEAVELADRIDCFLVPLERGGTLAQLARDCRDDLDLLLVLADCCNDSGRFLTAADARHLHALVESQLRASPWEITTPPLEDEVGDDEEAAGDDEDAFEDDWE